MVGLENPLDLTESLPDIDGARFLAIILASPPGLTKLILAIGVIIIEKNGSEVTEGWEEWPLIGSQVEMVLEYMKLFPAWVVASALVFYGFGNLTFPLLLVLKKDKQLLDFIKRCHSQLNKKLKRTD